MRLPKAFPCAPLNRFQDRKDCKSLACVRLGLAFFRDLFDRTEPRRSSAQACGSSAQVQPSRLCDPGHAQELTRALARRVGGALLVRAVGRGDALQARRRPCLTALLIGRVEEGQERIEPRVVGELLAKIARPGADAPGALLPVEVADGRAAGVARAGVGVRSMPFS